MSSEKSPDVLVTVEGGVAMVNVLTINILVEVRDFDIDGVDNDSLWEDEEGNMCRRYFVE